MVSDQDFWCTRHVFWGSHGCDKGNHTDDIHECKECSQCRIVDDDASEVRFMQADGSWGDWQAGWSWFTFNPDFVPKLP